jgi:hypothetical protein
MVSFLVAVTVLCYNFALSPPTPVTTIFFLGSVPATNNLFD